MLLDFKLPDIGEGVAEGEIVNWLVQIGDEVQEHQGVVEVSTDKAVVEVPAPATGRITKILAEAGQVVPTHSVIFQMEVGAKERGLGVPPSPQPSPVKGEGAGPEARHVPSSSENASSLPLRERDRERGRHNSARLAAAPSARRVARELDIDLHDVTGSGRNGVIRRSDVEAFASGNARSADGASSQTSPLPGGEGQGEGAQRANIRQGRVTRTPFIGLRRRIAQQMARSVSTAAHFTAVEEVDVTDLVQLMPKAKQLAEARGVKVTYTAFIMKALTSALLEHPSLNAMLDESANEIVTYHYVNLGVAVDAPQGLVVPVVRDAQDLGVLDLSAALAQLTQKARAGKLTPQDMQGGTFTLSNAGQIGSIHATPIINVPEVGILGAHRIVKRPGVVDAPDGERIEVRHYMNISMSVDHRLADGMVAVKALVHVRNLLEHPGLLAL